MNLNHLNSAVPVRLLPRSLRFGAKPSVRLPFSRRTGSIVSSAVAFVSSLLAMSGHAMAAATPSTNGMGAQFQNMAQEGTTTAGFVGSAVMYGCAIICFAAGSWYLYQSRQEQNRTAGKVSAGLAGWVLCGLFATGPQWINKSANTASNGNASITDTSGAFNFGNNGG